MTQPTHSNSSIGLPYRTGWLSRRLGTAVGSLALKILGWKIEGELPNAPKVLAIAYPHTSNWDFIIGLAVMLKTNLKASWIAKAEMFRSPLGGLWKKLGGIPIVRGHKLGIVEQQVQAIQRAERMFMLIEPEGTRSAVDTWKTGFYHIATGADVPLLPVTWDFPSKTLTFLPLFQPTGDMDADIAELMRLGKDCRGKNPKNSPWQQTV